jgi:hypothetical protein
MAFKMKEGSPMYRNYGIGTPMKVTDPVKPKPVKSATSNVLDSLSEYGKGGASDPVEQAKKNADDLATQGAWIGRHEGAYENRDKDRVAAINAKNMADAEKLRKTGADAKFIANAGIAKNETDQRNADKAASDETKEAAKNERKRWASLTNEQRLAETKASDKAKKKAAKDARKNAAEN